MTGRRAASLLGGRLQGLVREGEQQGAGYATSNLFGTGSRLPSAARKAPSAALQERGKAMPARQEKAQPDMLPLTHIDQFGAMSIVGPGEANYVPTSFENVDGRRIEDGRYAAFVQEISGGCGAENDWLAGARPAGAARRRSPPALLPANPLWCVVQGSSRLRASSRTRCAPLPTAPTPPSTASTPSLWSRCGRRCRCC